MTSPFYTPLEFKYFVIISPHIYILAYVKVGQLLLQKRVVANEVPKDRLIKQFFLWQQV